MSYELPTCSLEAEAIHIMREVAAEFERPVLLFCGGKDSIVLLRLAEKAFRPALPVPAHARRHGPQLPRGDRVPRPPRRRARRAADRRLRAGLDRRRAASSRRPARARRATACRPSRCSTRSPSTASTPRSAAPAATRSAPARRSGSSPSATTSASGTRRASAPSCGPLQRPHPPRRARARVPALNWTELDVWQYIAEEGLELPSIYFAHEREVFHRDGMLYALSPFIELLAGEEPFTASVRYRTVGDMTCTGAVAVDRRDARRGRRRDRRDAHHRARRDARRRPRQRGRDGGPQARGLLLVSPERGHSSRATARRSPLSTPAGTAARRHRRLGRRRQVDADRPAALRLQAGLRGPARARRARRAAARGDGDVDLALLTDGLRAEREQGITIDVAYRYFATPRRKFIIADTPGHVHYTRNMVTGASTADLAIILVDARKGVDRADAAPRLHRLAARRPAPRRRASTRWTSSTGTRTLFEGIVETSRTSPPSSSRPTSRSSRSPRCTATTSSSARAACRGTRARRCSTTSSTSTSRRTATSSTPLPRAVGHPPGTRSTTTTAATPARSPPACCAPGDEVLVLPSGDTTRIAVDRRPDGPVEEAFPPMSVDAAARGRPRHLARRHDLPPAQPPRAGARARRDGLLDEREPLAAGDRLLLKHTTRSVHARRGRALPRRRRHLHRDKTADVARAQRHRPAEAAHQRAAGLRRLPPQPRHRQLHPHRRGDQRHRRRRHDPRGPHRRVGRRARSPSRRPPPNVTWHAGALSRDERWRALGQRGATVWLTGLPASGKSTIAAALEQRLVAQGRWPTGSTATTCATA